MKSLTLYEGSCTLSADEFDLRKFQSSLNYGESAQFPEPIREFLSDVLLPSMSEYPVLYQYCLSQVHNRETAQRSIHLTPDVYISGSIIYRLLKYSDRVIILLASIRRDQVYDGWEDYIAYSFYNLLLHQTLEKLRKQVIGIMGISDMQLTQRYAPGYCGWPITDQRALLSLLEPGKIGVKLSESYMLEPVHTVTGLFGIRRRTSALEKMPCYSCTSVSCKVHYDFQKEYNSLLEISDVR